VTASASAAATPTPGTDADRPTYPDPGVTPAGFAPAPAGTGLSGYLSQPLTWKPCGGRAVCADVLVPLDYAHPSAQAITLSLRKLPATGTPTLGTLFVNPGGPGEPGKDFITAFDATGLSGYDLIGWDPRGVGDSTPVTCYGGAQTDALNNLDASPDTPAEREALIQGDTALGKSCWEHSGTLLDHISTADTARDLDLLRALVGDDKLNYFGYSYGTQIGATYATLFASRVGHMVLDGAVDITDAQSSIQAVGFDLALRDFASWCASQRCAFGTTPDAVIAAVTGLFDRLDGHPVSVGERELTQSQAVWGVAMMLYGGKASWPRLADAVEQARSGQGATLLASADELNGRGADGQYSSLFYSFDAIRCLDTTDKGIAGADAQWAADRKAAPVFGTYEGPDYVCPLWPVPPAPRVHIAAPHASPILVIGTTGDPATPYQQAVTMAKQLGSGVLLTYDGEGHGAYGGKSACVDDAVVAYLTRGTVPAKGATCH